MWFRRKLTPAQVGLVVRALLASDQGECGVARGEFAEALAWIRDTDEGAAVLPMLAAGSASIEFDESGCLLVTGTPGLLKPVGERDF